jgi:hypothetical protein
MQIAYRLVSGQVIVAFDLLLIHIHDEVEGLFLKTIPLGQINAGLLDHDRDPAELYNVSLSYDTAFSIHLFPGTFRVLTQLTSGCDNHVALFGKVLELL